MKKDKKYHSTFKSFKYTVMLFMLVPMLVLGTFIVGGYSKSSFAELEQRREIVLSQITNDVEEQFNEVLAMIRLYPYKTTLQKYLLLDKEYFEPIEYSHILMGARGDIEEMVSVSRYSCDVLAFSLVNDCVMNYESGGYASKLQKDWYKKYVADGKIERAFADDTYITITKKVTGDASARQKSADNQAVFDSMLIIKYNKIHLRNDLNISQYKSDIALNLYSTDGELLFSTGNVTESYKKEKDIKIANVKMEAVFGDKDEQNIISNVITYSLICICLCLLSAYIVSTLCAKFLYKTVRKVFSKMGSVGEPSLKSAGNNSYIELDGNEDTEEKLAKLLDKMQNMQLTSLQMQINPHFVFNVLNYVNLKMFGNDEAKEKSSQILILLSEMLDYAMSEPKYSASVFEEIEITKKYIEIENVKTDNGFDVVWNVDKNVLDKECIKLFLQPIVENSIMHGIKMLKDRRGIIEITAKAEAGGVSFEVSDNGVGMTPEILQKVRARLLEDYSDSSKHIGLRNVNERIKMVYGKEYGVTINSDTDGTKVTIRIGGGYNPNIKS